MSLTAGPDDFQLADYGGVLRRRWWLVLVVAIIGAVAGAGYLKTAHKVYEANASVYVTATSATSNQVANGRTTGAVNLDTEAQVVQSTAVAQAAAKLMHSSEPITKLINRVNVTVPPNSQVLSISCQEPSPDAAATCAESFAKAYLSYSSATTIAAINSQLSSLQSRISGLESNSAKLTSEVAILPVNSTQRATAEEQLNSYHNQLSSLNSQVAGLTADLSDPSGGSIISDAVPPASATSPKALLILPSGLLAGLIIGLILAFIIDRRDHRVRKPRDVSQLNVPVLMSLPLKGSAPQLAIAAPRSREGRHFAELAHVLTGSLGSGHHVILVTDATEGQGAGFVAANLAVALARTQPDVTLVCGNVEGSVIPGMAGLPSGPGLTEVLAGLMSTGEVSQFLAAAPRLQVIMPGSAAGVEAGELQQDAVEELFTALRAEARYVVVEAPPVPSGSDVYTLAQVADTTVLVVEMPRTRSDQVLDSVQHFEKMDAPVPGAVLLPSPKAVARGDGPSRVPAGNVRPERPEHVAAPVPHDVAPATGSGSKTLPFARVSSDEDGGTAGDPDGDWTAAEGAPSFLRGN
jgi:capsular polysaccharide biosynthesis protein